MRFAATTRKRAESGYILFTTGICAVGVLAMTGLAIDLGRMYVAKNETQSFVDAAAVATALELDGTFDGINRSKQTLDISPNRWNFGSAVFTNSVLEFSNDAAGPWEAAPSTAAGYAYTRVTATVDVPITFIQAVALGSTRAVKAVAAAGQIPMASAHEGTCPFSPFVHEEADLDNFGMVKGNRYTLLWSVNPRMSNPASTCPGDREQRMLDLVRDGGAEEKGYIEDTSTSVIREAVVGDYQTYTRGVGGYVTLVGGRKQTMSDAMQTRVGYDTDQVAPSFNAYSNGNGRRIMTCPVNNGVDGGYRVIGFASFFLDRAVGYDGNAINPFCAEYIGNYVQGTDHVAAGDKPGLHVVRLVQ